MVCSKSFVSWYMWIELNDRLWGTEQDHNANDSYSRINSSDFHRRLDRIYEPWRGDWIQLEPVVDRLQGRIRFQWLGRLLAGTGQIAAVTEDFWLGLERLHLLTTSGSYRVRLEWQEAVTDYWLSTEYWNFYIDDEVAIYKLHVSGYVHGDDGRAL